MLQLLRFATSFFSVWVTWNFRLPRWQWEWATMNKRINCDINTIFTGEIIWCTYNIALHGTKIIWCDIWARDEHGKKKHCLCFLSNMRILEWTHTQIVCLQKWFWNAIDFCCMSVVFLFHVLSFDAACVFYFVFPYFLSIHISDQLSSGWCTCNRD